MGPLRANFSEILIEIYIFIQENAFEIVVKELAVIFLGLNVLKKKLTTCGRLR